MRLILAALALSLPFFTSHAEACGPESNCDIGNERHYRIRMPEGHDGKTPVGAIIYAHGYKGSAAGAMRNKSLGKAISDLGLALISVKSAGPDWQIPNSPQQHPPEAWVELDYYDAVIKDVGTRFAVDTSKLMATGFSAGGMMTWTLACERADRFAGFAPISGTFWHPHPPSCESEPAHIIHTHGTSDRVVPLKGRQIGPTSQGNVFNVLKMYAANGAYQGDGKSTPLDLECLRALNPDKKVLEFCIHKGGHEFKTQYIVRAWQELEKLGALN